jgi:hypothetical protein
MSTTLRQFRMDDPIWDAMVAIGEQTGQSTAAVIRKACVALAKEHGIQVPESTLDGRNRIGLGRKPRKVKPVEIPEGMVQIDIPMALVDFLTRVDATVWDILKPGQTVKIARGSVLRLVASRDDFFRLYTLSWTLKADKDATRQEVRGYRVFEQRLKDAVGSSRSGPLADPA